MINLLAVPFLDRYLYVLFAYLSVRLKCHIMKVLHSHTNLKIIENNLKKYHQPHSDNSVNILMYYIF